MEKQLATNPNALWDGVKFFATGTDYNFFLICSILQQATRVRQRGGMIRWTRYLTEAMTQVQIFLHLRCSYYELVIAQLLGLTIHILVLMLIQTIFLPLQPLDDDKYAIKFFFAADTSASSGAGAAAAGDVDKCPSGIFTPQMILFVEIKLISFQFINFFQVTTTT